MAESYTAGRLLVAVIPDMRGASARVRKEFSGLGPYDVKVSATVDAKALAGLRASLRSLPDVVITADSSPADRELATLRGRIASLSAQRVGIDVSAEAAHREVDSIRSDLTRLSNESPDIAVRVDAGAAEASLRSVSTELGSVDGRQAKIKVSADTGSANAALAVTDAAASRLDGRRSVVSVLADTGRAVAQIAAVAATANALANRRYTVSVTADTASAAAGILKIIALVTTLGGLGGVVGGLAGALGGLGAAGAVAGAGLGASLLGFLGVGKALTALTAQQETAGATAKASAQKQAQAAQQVQAAQDRLAQASIASGRARSDAERDIGRASAEVGKARESAARSVAKAERQAADSVATAVTAAEAAYRRQRQTTADLRQAQADLTRAWEDGRRSLEDLQDQVDGNALDQRQAAFDLADARKALAAAQAGGNADEIGRAQLALDRQLETIDQLNKRTQRGAVDNAAAQRAGVVGSEAYSAALDKVRSAYAANQDATAAAGAAATAVRNAQVQGAADVAEARSAGAEQVQAAEQRLSDVQEQSRRSIQAADQQVIEAQRALTAALQQTGDEGQSAADKVAQAFAALSPAAAEFARYLFGLKPILDGLSATAAAGLFPPLQAGIATLLGQLPVINTVVGQLSSGMGQAFKLVLEQLASPFWVTFFQLLGNAAGTIIPGLFGSLMTVARAVATLVTAFLPLAPAGFAVLDMLSGLLAGLAGPLAQAFGAMIPAAQSFIGALGFLGPLLVALSPILNAMGVALSQVLGAALQALTPILVALTPFLVQFAQTLAVGLVGAIQSATPFLVTLATWMSENPGLVMGVVGAVVTLLGFLRPLGFVLGLVATWAIRAAIIGSLGAIFAAVGLQGSLLARVVFAILQPFSALKLAFGAASAAASAAGGWMALLRNAVMWIGRAILVALGPVGILIAAFGLLYASSEPFRAAINGLLGVIMTLIGQLVGAVMPIFTALSGVLGMLGGIVGALVGQLAAALVPVITVVTGVLVQLVGAVLPPMMQIIGALVPVIGLLGGVFATLLGALSPIIAVFGQLVAMILPPLVGLLTSAVVPIIVLLARVLSTVLTFAINYLVIPALKLIMWVITTLLVPAITWLVSMIVPAFEGIGAAAMWLWTNAIKPAFDFISTAAKILFAVVMTVLITPLLIAWNVLSAAAMWLWTNAIKPAFDGIGAAIDWVISTIVMPLIEFLVWYWQNVLSPAVMWLWHNVIKPAFDGIGAAIDWVISTIVMPLITFLVWYWQNVLSPAAMWLWHNVIKPAFDGIGAVIKFVWEKVIKPAFDAVMGGLDWLGKRFEDATNWIRDIWGRIRGYLAKPINFMINTVWNHGVVPAWNAVAGLVGLGPIKELAPIPEAATGGRVDTAGKIHGPGTGTSDSIMARVAETDRPLRVSNREFIMNAKATRRNLPVLTAMNGGAEIGGPRVPGLAAGGPVSWQELQGTVLNKFPNARITDTTRPGAHDFHGAGKAIDIGGTPPGNLPSMLKINHWIAQNYGGSAELIHTQPGAINIKNGKGHQYSRSVQEGHRDHVHWANNGGNPGGFKGFIAGIGQSISSFFRDSVAGAFDKFTNPAIGALRAAVGPPPPAWREAVPALATKMRDTVRDWVFGKADAKDSEASAGGGGTMGPIGDGERFVISQIADSARAHGVGFDGGVIGVATGIVESGLRNLNYGDRDSVGVFQQRGNGAWGSLEQRMNVRHAADMFYNKLVSFNWRAMDPGAAAQKVQVSAFPARYGQEMGRARELLAQHGGPFDDGGMAFGKGIMFKDVIAPERVLDPVETEDHNVLGDYRRMLEDGRLVPARGLDPRQLSAMTGSGPGGREMHLHVHGDVNDPMDVDSLYNQLDFRDRSASL